MSVTEWSDYLKAIENEIKSGGPTEHTHRPALKRLIESLANGITATNEPKRVACGAPDFVVSKAQTPLGYIETKDIGKNLDQIERDEQMGRYLAGLGNLILTDYLEFRWYVGGEHRLTARLARLGANNKLIKEKDGAQEVSELLNQFLSTQFPTVGSPRELAAKMAALARQIRHSTLLAVQGEDLTDDLPDPLHDQMDAFRKILLHDLTEEQFADMYAQTICYGLFAARCNAQPGGKFTREHAAWDLPKTNPFLKQMFSHIAGPDLSDSIVWAVDDLAELLNRADIESILRDFGKRTRQEDPVVHFYETFLAHYDNKMREARGVYYTPEPVVSYIVRSVDHILKTDFNLPDGLADSTKIKIKDPRTKEQKEVHKVQILDPATGTGTFLHGVIDQIYEKFQSNKGMWSGYVSQHLLPRLFGFELLMAPYAVAHMKLGLQLKETGYNFGSDERLRIFLTNTLEEADEYAGTLFATWLSQEANAASKVKQDVPVMVVLGNPPYSANSANMGKWINAEVRSHYYPNDDIKEQNPKLLLDDYVKFIRFAQWRIEQTGYGILAFITNHSYLDNPTFRGLRKNLIDTFDEICILNLHGNKKKKEAAPDGLEDVNVFDIQQGVSIGIFVKRPGKRNAECIVKYADLWGTRSSKYKWLFDNTILTTNWTQLAPRKPFHLFIRHDTAFLPEYEQARQVNNIHPLNTTGIKTHRDHFVFSFDYGELKKRIEEFRDLALSDESISDKYNLTNTRDWILTNNRRLLAANQMWETKFTQCLYRPFDVREYYHDASVVELPRDQVMQHMRIGANWALITTRQTKDKWDCLCTSKLCIHKSCAAYDTNNVFPLYLYPTDTPKSSLFDLEEPSDAPGGRRPNLSPEFIQDFSKKLGMEFVSDGKGDRVGTFGPEDVFSYMYAVFHSPTYRTRYAEFLKIDFPRLPLTSNKDLFRELCALGDELVGLHLMEKTAPTITTYPEAGDNRVENVRYTEADRRVWINSTQYFEGVPQNVWEFHIGGYQVCTKWLKDRKGRMLSYDDLTHYQNTISALAETIRLMEQIDAAIEKHNSWPIK